jgi:small subunit ribosomal protein S8
MRNAQAVDKEGCSVPHSKLKKELCELLKKEGWIADVQEKGEGIEKTLEVTFAADKPKLELKRISTPGQRVYKGSGDLKPVLQGFGAAVLTTSQGLMTDTEARDKKIGGEILCTVA